MAAKRTLPGRQTSLAMRCLGILIVIASSTGCIDQEIDAAMWAWRLM